MQTNVRIPASVADISAYLHSAARLSQQAILGSVVTEIMRSGRSLNRKAICSKLISRLQHVTSPEEEQHYHELIGLLLEPQFSSQA
ncbi:regulatory protein YcgZ [Pantoea sp. C2G6]|uniref:regulatory protein YcgZ n=1 Tax=Pantoea sp. C2G6 TaxID=3243084 RepID=UPI003EDADAC8